MSVIDQQPIRLSPRGGSVARTVRYAAGVVTLITAICGVVFGLGALLLSMANFLRDRAKLVVTLIWDVKVTGEPTEGSFTYDPNKRYILIAVANIGRRPVYLAGVKLRLPDHTEIIAGNPMKDVKLSEGDPPARFLVDPDLVVKYASAWDQFRAIATDSAGHAYKSKKLTGRPSWAAPRN